MKYLKLEYPNNNIHNIIVKEMGTYEDNYFITYYDLTEHQEKYGLLEEENNTYKKTKNITSDELESIKENYEYINPNILPKRIKCIENENNTREIFLVYKTKEGMYLNKEKALKFKIGNLKAKKLIEGQICIKVSEEEIHNIEKENPNQKAFFKLFNTNKREFFTVYTVKNNFYLNEDLCKIYNIGDRKNKKYIKDQKCFKITKKDINSIENDNLKATYTQIFQTQRKLSFNVYVKNNESYILEEICKSFNIENKDIEIIEGYRCCKVSDEDINQIEKTTENCDPKLTRRYRNVKTEENFTVLKTKNNLYIPETLSKYVNIDNPKIKIYENKNYILVNENLIDAITIILNKKPKYKDIQKETKFIVFNDLIDLYIDEYIAKLFRINYGEKHIYINNIKYVQVIQKDIEYIENITNNLDTKLIAKNIILKK